MSAAVATKNYYQDVVTVTEEFLGPAAERFINRQIEFHLEKAPKTINRADVLVLRDSLRVALGVLISDKSIIDQAVTKFDNLVKE